MKRFLCMCLGITAVATAKPTPTPPPKQPTWDSDLFRRDKTVVSTHLEFLYWKPQAGALDYALAMKTPAWGPSASFAQGNYKTGSYNMAPGFRVSLSYFRAPKEWEVWGCYTRLTARGRNHASKPSPTTQFLTSTWPENLTLPLTGATSSLHLNYNTADMIVDRFINPNAHLRLRLMGALTTAWLDQYWAAQYFDASGATSRVVNTWSFAGAGLRLGTTIDWFWTSDIYLSARASFAGLMGCYKNHAKQTTSVATTGADNAAIPIRNATYRDGRAAVNAQLLLGPSWQKNFCSMRVEAFAGYEINVWSNLQEIYHSTSGSPSAPKETWTNSSLLSLQGLTVRLTMDY